MKDGLALTLEKKEQRQAALATWLENWQQKKSLNLPHQSSKIVLEIGCGHGHFINAYAQAHPYDWILGIDLMQGRLSKAEKKKIRLNLPHVYFLKAEVLELLESWPKSALIEKVYLLFSDPWPKRKHYKNRVVQKTFLTLLATCMSPNGQFYFRTDDASYFDWTVDLIHKHPLWNINPNALWEFEAPSVFERKTQHYFSCIAEVIPL